MALVEIIGQQPLVEVTPSEPAEVTITPGGNIRINVVISDNAPSVVSVAATQGPQGIQGIQGIPGVAGPNQVTTTTATNINGILAGNGSTVEEAQIASGRLLGRSSAGTGDIEQITIGVGLQLSGGQLISTATGVPSGTASGTDTYTATIANVTGYNTNDGFIIKFTNSNTGTATLNINGLGAKNIFKSVNVALSSGDIKAGQELVVVYDGTNFQAIGLAPTKAEVGLGNVDNTSDLNKPISTATQTALNGKENTINPGTTSQYFRGDKTFQTLNKNAVGLSNVDNTSDANKPISTATQTALNAKQDSLGYTPVNKAGDTMTGDLILNANPTAALGAATKDYVDTLINGIDWKASVQVATVAALPAYGVTGSGQILTGSVNGAIPTATTDGRAALFNERILVKNEAGALAPNNGIYVVTQVGNGSLPFILTRSQDANTSAELAEATLSVNFGNTLSNTQWHCNPASLPITIGGTDIFFAQIGSGVYTNGAGLALSGNVFSIANNGVTDAMIQSAATWNAKQDALNSGVNIKTIEGQSIVGAGNIDLTKSDVGLSNVDNTSDLNKPISTATQTALNGKENTIVAGTTSQYYRGDKTFQTLDKAAVGLGNVDNTSDANKPISTATQAALNGKQDTLTNPVTGTGTNNQIAFFNTTGSTIGSLSTTTYPSLTELSYVKGVNSSIQAQINALVESASVGGDLYLYYNY